MVDLQQDLLKQYRLTGNLKYLNALFYPLMELVFGLCLKYLKNPTDAEDAVMDIYLSLTEKLKTHEVQHFKSWLYIVSKNHCLDVLRSKGKKINKEIEAHHMYSDLVFHLNEGHETEQQMTMLEKCLERLPSEQLQVLKWFYFEKKSYKEIATLIDKDWNKIRSYIQNGRRNLKICMEEK